MLLVGCTIDGSIVALEQSSQISTEFSVTGLSDSTTDTTLSGSPFPYFSWKNTGDSQYKVTIYDATGTTEVCPSVDVNGNFLEHLTCTLSDYSTYTFEALPIANGTVTDLNRGIRGTFTTKKLRWSKSRLELFPGESIILSFLDGEGPFTASSIAEFFDQALSTYTAPLRTTVLSDTLQVTDSHGTKSTIPVKIHAFTNEAPPTTYAKGGENAGIIQLAETALGNIVAVGTPNGPRGNAEAFVIYRSTDKGQTFTAVDTPAPDFDSYFEGYAHDIVVSPTNGVIYACGNFWNDRSGNTEIIIRKSVDDGVTWSTALHLYDNSNDYYCYNLAVNSSGHVFFSGYDDLNGSLIKVSKDQGQTWTPILQDSDLAPADLSALLIMETDPWDNLWLMTSKGILKGTYNSGTDTWTWTKPVTGPTSFIVSYGAARSHFFIFESSTTFYAATYKNGAGSAAQVWKTTDGGVNWTSELSIPTFYKSNGLSRADDGSLLFFVQLSSYQNRLYRKPPAGAWGVLTVTNPTSGLVPVGYEGTAMLKLSDGTLVGVISDETDAHNNPMRTLTSTDNGATWTFGTRKHVYLNHWANWTENAVQKRDDRIVLAYQGLNENNHYGYSIITTTDGGKTWVKEFDKYMMTNTGECYQVQDFAKSTSGKMIIAGYKNYTSACFMRSNDNGATWISSDLTDPASRNHLYLDFATNGTAYSVSQKGATYSLLKSTDAGQSWTETSTLVIAGTTTVEYRDFRILNDGTLALAAWIDNTYLAVYYSNDDGTTWTEKMRSPHTSSVFKFKLGADQKLYVFSSQKVFVTADNGTTWTELSLDAGMTSIKSLVADKNGKLYVLNSAGLLQSKSFETGAWVTLEDISTNPSPKIQDWDPFYDLFLLGENSFGFILESADLFIGGQHQMRKMDF